MEATNKIRKTQSVEWIIPQDGEHAPALELISDLLGEINKTVYLSGLSHNPKWGMEMTKDLRQMEAVVEVICGEVC